MSFFDLRKITRYNPVMDTQLDPHQFTRDGWDAKADVWDSRMGDEGNDFFNMDGSPSSGRTLFSRALHHILNE